tara:strand:- start:1409 stop:1813 length:405 start_codon:yes stop_codon:yes gene_type:complete
MTIGSWDPSDKKTPVDDTVDCDLLKRLLAAVNDLPCELADALSSTDLQQTHIIKASPSAWHHAINELSNQELVSLIQFFTLVEMQLPNWTAGAQSPAILINKALRKRGEKLNKETLLWIKKNTDNRFIPNGSPF